MSPTALFVVATLAVVATFILATITGAIRKRFLLIQDYQIALRVRFGRVVGRLEPGLRFRRLFEDVQITDTRARDFTVSAQEVTTKDSLPVKVSASVQYSVTSPEKARHTVIELSSEMYRLIQIALRDAVTGCELEALLADRSSASALLLARLVADAEALGVTIQRAVVLDVIVRGELKSALGEVVKARAEARAKLERARGETAVLRNLANAAKMIREHGGLYELRALEAAQQAAASTSNTLVLGLDRSVSGVGER